MSFYDSTGNPSADIAKVFDSSDESDELDMDGISSIQQRLPKKQIEVKEGNRFKLNRFTAEVPEKTHLLRLPAAFGIQEKPFDRTTYSEQEELAELVEKKRTSRAEALIRWRWKKDSNGIVIRDARGKPIRESNARIVKWSDGSYQLLIGDDNVIDLQLQDNAENSQFVVAVEKAVNEDTERESEMLEVESHLSSRMVFSPRHLAPLPKDLAEKQRDAIDFILNAPEKSMTGKGRRGTRTRNHAVKDKAMDRDFLVEDEDDDMNLSNIKEKGRSGRFTMLVEYEDDYSNEE
ncbi:hypothetical protein WA171_002186 [Blastocystis sp. BT1]